MKEFKKITDKKANVSMVSQGCKDDCEEIIWCGRTAEEGNDAGCWWANGNTPRTTTWW